MEVYVEIYRRAEPLHEGYSAGPRVDRVQLSRPAIPDGVFVLNDAAEVRFVGLDAPSDDALAKLVRRIAARVRELLDPIRAAKGQDARPPDPLADAQTEAQASVDRRRRPQPAPKS